MMSPNSVIQTRKPGWINSTPVKRRNQRFWFQGEASFIVHSFKIQNGSLPEHALSWQTHEASRTLYVLPLTVFAFDLKSTPTVMEQQLCQITWHVHTVCWHTRRACFFHRFADREHVVRNGALCLTLVSPGCSSVRPRGSRTVWWHPDWHSVRWFLSGQKLYCRCVPTVRSDCHRLNMGFV